MNFMSISKKLFCFILIPSPNKMCNLDAKSIDIMLKNLEKNQSELKKDYSERIDKLEKKFDDGFESIRQEIKSQTAEMQQTFVSRVEFQYTQDKLKQLEEDRKKLVWIVITAVVWAVLSLVILRQ